MAVIQATTLNSGIAIVPNGTGAITAQVPDGTATGGNARGQFAVDLQTDRNINTQVASGDYSVVMGGKRNTSSGNNSTTSGYKNTASNNGSVALGWENNASGNYAIALGVFSNASSNYSTVSGGQSNTASTGTHATVVGGSGNTSSGQYSISGGLDNTASGSRSTALGFDNVSSGSYSFAGGRANDVSGESSAALGEEVDITANYSFGVGRSNTVASQYSAVFGRGVKSYLYNSNIRGGQIFASRGDCQATELVANKSDDLTTGGTTVLSLDGTGTTNLIIPDGNNRAWNVTVEYIGVCTAAGSGTTAVGDVVTGTDKFRFKRVGGTSTIGSVTNIELTQDATMTSAECTYTVGGSNDLQISFAAPTTANATTFRVVAKVSLVEVAW